MAGTGDLRSRYDALVKTRDAAKKANEQAQIELKVLEVRQAEFVKEAKAFGVASLEELESQIAAEEAAIVKELSLLEESLKTGTALAVKSEVKESSTITSLDDLLSMGIR